MTLSSKVVKAGEQVLSKKRVAVDVTIPTMAEEPFDEEFGDAVSEVVERTKSEARAILEQADREAEQVRRRASEEGYQEGLLKGRADATAAVSHEWQTLREQLEEPLQWIRKTRQYLDSLRDESTLALAAALAMALYSRLKTERLDVIATYIAEMVTMIDAQKVSVFLDSTWASRVDVLGDLVEQSVPEVSLKVDAALESGTMRVEGENGGLMGGPLISLRALLSEVMG